MVERYDVFTIVFVVKNNDGKNDHRSYNSIYFNYFLISYYRVRLFLAMQVRVMAACMESQSFIRSAQSRPRDGTCVSDVCELFISSSRTKREINRTENKSRPPQTELYTHIALQERLNNPEQIGTKDIYSFGIHAVFMYFLHFQRKIGLI